MKCENDFLTGLGIASSLNGLSCMIAAPILGKISDLLDSQEPGFVLGGGALLISSILTIVYRPVFELFPAWYRLNRSSSIKFKTKHTVSRPPDNPTRFFKPNQDEFCAKKRKINYNRGYKLFTLVWSRSILFAPCLIKQKNTWEYCGIETRRLLQGSI